MVASVKVQGQNALRHFQHFVAFGRIFVVPDFIQGNNQNTRAYLSYSIALYNNGFVAWATAILAATAVYG